MISLLDVNLLLALAWSNHPQHDAAHRWFSQHAQGGWGTCLLTQSAFLRLSLNPQAVKATISCQTAVDVLRQLTTHQDHHYIDANAPLVDASFAESIPRIAGYRQITDATLLHFCRTNGLRIVTFDRGFANLCPDAGVVEVLMP